MIKGCIFDLDGTLANTLDSIVFFANSALKECGYPEIPQDQYRYLVGNGADNLIRGMLYTVKGREADPEEIARVRKIYDGLYESDPLYLVTQYDGLQELLQELKKRDRILAVLSNKPDNVVQMVVDQLFSKDIFTKCYGQRPEIPRKPSPAGALRIAEECGLQPQECFYLGDTDVDMKTGTAAGMQTIGVLWGFRDREELVSNGAKWVVSHPLDVLSLLEKCNQENKIPY